VCSRATLSRAIGTAGIIAIADRMRIATAVVNRIVTVNCIHIAVITTIMLSIWLSLPFSSLQPPSSFPYPNLALPLASS
jgi:hypothetical protein